MKNKIVYLCLIVLLGTFLRFYQVDKFPPGLYVDEASIGYNAYTILHTGKDEYGVPYPLFFKSFGDYKQPVYIYMTSAAIALFGKNDFAVRFPSALFGSATVLIMYFFCRLLLENRKKNEKNKVENIALLSSFLLAISPWHIHFSRGGFEVNVGLFFYILGLYLFLLFWQKRELRFLFISGTAFVITLYTYHTYKILTPLTWIVCCAPLFYINKDLRKKIFLTSVVIFILSIPLIHFSLTSQGTARFDSTSAFSQVKAKGFLQKEFIYPAVYIKNYISFFSPQFLFSFGDHNGRHQVVDKGLLYKWELPFLLLGAFWMLKQKSKKVKFAVFGLLAAAPLIPAVAVPSPHTLRALLMVIPLSLLVASGMYVIFFHLRYKGKKMLICVLTLLIVYEFALYIHEYYSHYTNINALDWGGGYEQTVEKAVMYQKNYPVIIVDKTLNFAPVYFHFYAPDLKVSYVGNNSRDIAGAQSGKTLFIRPFYGNRNEKSSIDQVYLPGPNKDIFSQFWKL
jgi:4-amino-4-deoxy-L-arabinose transferase-like glycosyltransferase